MAIQPIEYQSIFNNLTIRKLLIANRGEIAVRIARTAQDLGIETVAIYSEEDKASGHIGACDSALPLKGNGSNAYLDQEQIIAIAKQQQCDAIHPGYGFLSENSEFAERCHQHQILFVGPEPATLALFGNKLKAKALATSCGVATSPGTTEHTTLEQAHAFFRSLPPGNAMMIKAVCGGGGKGMRIVRTEHELESAYNRCQLEAQKAFGNGEVYVEKLIENARHIEVQIIADGHCVTHLWDRECTLQRQHQKLFEIAPSPSLSEQQRRFIFNAATQLAKTSGYRTIGTFEFLMDLDSHQESNTQENNITFLEANPRIQVEHTVTEEILGLDLVLIQLALASGKTLEDINLTQNAIPNPRGYAAQLRINMETLDENGVPLPAGGTLTAFNPPFGSGIRIDTFARNGYQTVSQFDSLLAKLVVHSPISNYTALLKRAHRAAQEFHIEGVSTNLALFEALLTHPNVINNQISTRFIEQHIHELNQNNNNDPHNHTPHNNHQQISIQDNQTAVYSSLHGVITQIQVEVGQAVNAGEELVLIEAMKLEHAITARQSGIVNRIFVNAGDTVNHNETLLVLDQCDNEKKPSGTPKDQNIDSIREDLQQVQALINATLDAHRPKAVEKRHSRGQRTARENIEHLCDADSFTEYGQLTVAYLHARKNIDELREQTPADGFVMGIATVNADLFGKHASQVAVGSYDATVMAGTQGHKNHQKTDRLFDLAKDHRLPLILFAEGGGGRPREDPVTIAALENQNFYKLAELKNTVPVIGIVSGRCFAGNAVLLGMADVIIATENSNIGMAGPALIEAGGLGSFTPEQVGPIEVQHQNGVVDIRVADEQQAVEKAKQYLSYFQGTLNHWEASEPKALRHVIPENRLRAYDVRDVIELLADNNSVLELRSGFGQAYVSALIRVEGRPMGVMANNPKYNSGAIDADSANKAARFMKLCDAHGLPLLTLIDTPGIMVGPEAEKTALVRHSAEMFVTAAAMKVPVFAIVLRKAYGLGAMAAAGGHFKAPFFTVAWPTGELGGMGLEGGVRLAYKKELEAIKDPKERQAFFEERVAARYRKGKASYIASYFELDGVIDPADSRTWIIKGLNGASHNIP